VTSDSSNDRLPVDPAAIRELAEAALAPIVECAALGGYPEEVADEFPEQAAQLARIARDPLTPPDVLARLVMFVGESVVHNPALPDLLGADASWLAARDRNECMLLFVGLETMASAQARPLLEALAGHPEAGVRELVTSWPNVPNEVLERLTSDVSPKVRDCARRRIEDLDVPPAMLLRLRANDESGLRWWADARVHGLATQSGTDPTWLAELAFEADVELRQLVAKHPSMPAEVLARLAVDPDLEVRENARYNPSMPDDLEALLQAGEHAVWWAQEGDAENDDPPRSLTEAELARMFAGGPYARQLAAQQPQLPDTEQRQLARAPDTFVRMGIAGSPGASTELVEALAADPDPEVSACAHDELERRAQQR
jgi:hypothetical protein